MIAKPLVVVVSPARGRQGTSSNLAESFTADLLVSLVLCMDEFQSVDSQPPQIAACADRCCPHPHSRLGCAHLQTDQKALLPIHDLILCGVPRNSNSSIARSPHIPG